ncbi:conserved hypothetical protein [Tenacibaculum dicentrarchi]|uniref:CD-NTase-associated protein 12/Pycsar effector protein TIR domain-containing protein n=1 Tax=Tenacibaculum dicentrarchi TaxID=669041 RepID=A0ABP1EN49_9FLAO|nr:conserved hypothetical protein [Tenacibaculum dicentrarchi]
MNNKVSIFYSWQSDCPSDTNQKAISICIEEAKLKIKKDNNEIDISIDEAIRNKSGSPEIPKTIIEKIEKSDIFICDLTTINSSCNCNNRKSPNPNVVFELGYAVSMLGWERIIMVFNKKYGNFKDELPFDLEKRRVSEFKIDDKNDKSGKGNLTSILKTGIESIINLNPSKPYKIENNSVKRDRDIVILNQFLSSIHIETIDIFIQNLPTMIKNDMFFYFDLVRKLFESSNFFIYDDDLKIKLYNFYKNWISIIRYDNLFTSNNFNKDLILNLKFDVFEKKQDELDFKKMTVKSSEINVTFKELLDYIKKNYLIVDIEKNSELAKGKFIKYNS